MLRFLISLLLISLLILGGCSLILDTACGDNLDICPAGYTCEDGRCRRSADSGSDGDMDGCVMADCDDTGIGDADTPDDEPDRDADSDERCIPNVTTKCSEAGNIANFDSCGNEGELVKECVSAISNGFCCDLDHGGCSTAVCACKSGFSGPFCRRCVKYVNGVIGSDVDNSGNSWDSAYKTLTKGLSAATSSQCEIWVAKSLYVPGTDRDDTFRIYEGVDLYGGFSGNEVFRQQRDWKTNTTTLSGDVVEYGFDAYHVVSSYNNYNIIDGFTITGGWADEDDDTETIADRGGGISFTGGIHLVKNCIIEGNSSRHDGAGISVDNSTMIMINSIVRRNRHSISGTPWGGGGIFNTSSQSIIINSLVVNNEHYAHGAGIVNNNGSLLVLVNSTVASNDCGGDDQIASEGFSGMLARNSIIWKYDFVNGYTNSDHSLDDIRNSNISGLGYGDGDMYGNIGLNPLLDGLFYLTSGDTVSPCINAGENQEATYTDLDGHSRVGIADMGAYEFGSTVSTLDPLCGEGQTWSDNNHTYLYCPRVKLPWHGAEMYCRSLGGYLVSLTSEAENTFVAENGPAVESLWIGASDYQHEGSWIWVYNELGTGYANWAAAEPSPDDCAALYQADGTWRAHDCSESSRAFVCEVD